MFDTDMKKLGDLLTSDHSAEALCDMRPRWHWIHPVYLVPTAARA